MTSNNDKASQAFEEAGEAAAKGLLMNEKHIHICKATSKHHLWEHRDAQCRLNEWEGCVACPDHRPIPKHICLVSGNDVGTDTQQEGAEPDCYHCALAMLKALTLSGTASVAQDRDGVREAVIEECANCINQKVEQVRKLRPANHTQDRMKAAALAAMQALVDDVLALKRQPKEEGK